MNEYVFLLDLIDDRKLIAQYDEWHSKVWPEVEEQILRSGIVSCRIFRLENRLVMIVQSPIKMNWDEKANSDALHEKTMEWERLMWDYQKAIPGGHLGEKWRLAHLIYELK